MGASNLDWVPGLSGKSLPPMIRVRQRFESQAVESPREAARAALSQELIRPSILPGMRVALAVGSRGIAHLRELVSELVAWVRACGAEPFIVPAMGSHGGATADGQAAVLASYGVTAEGVGAPVRSSMDVVELGQVDTHGHVGSPVSVYMDRLAYEADAIIPVVRVKPHTHFRGPMESGLAKMLCIGLGKHVGCSLLHRQGYEHFHWLVPAAARVSLSRSRVAFFLAVIENAADQLAHVEAVPADAALEREPHLLQMARRWMPRLWVPQIDVLVVERIGKDISGAGLDPNVTGRSVHGPIRDFDGPRISRIVVLGLSPASHGNANGLGYADITVAAVEQAMDRRATYTNVLTSGSVEAGRLPLVMPDERSAILAATACVPGLADPMQARIVRIASTLHLEHIQVSEPLRETVARLPMCELLD